MRPIAEILNEIAEPLRTELTDAIAGSVNEAQSSVSAQLDAANTRYAELERMHAAAEQTVADLRRDNAAAEAAKNDADVALAAARQDIDSLQQAVSEADQHQQNVDAACLYCSSRLQRLRAGSRDAAVQAVIDEISERLTAIGSTSSIQRAAEVEQLRQRLITLTGRTVIIAPQ